MTEESAAHEGERSARLRREREFHDDRFADEHRQAASKYYAVDAGRVRYDTLVTSAGGRGRTVLEYGCGRGSKAFDLAGSGAQVVGIDISGVGVAEAGAFAEESCLDARFVQMDAEQLGYRAQTFDLVCGSGILHHLDIDRALGEIRRVLRPGGVAVFYEPLGSNPLINLYRRLTPSMRTPDEHPLLPRDFDSMRQRFEEIEIEHHNFFALAGVVLRKLPLVGDGVVRGLRRLDQSMFRRVPVTRKFAWVTVVRLHA